MGVLTQRDTPQDGSLSGLAIPTAPGSHEPPAGPDEALGALRPDVTSWRVCTVLVLLLTAGAAILDPRLQHWFVMPVAGCAILVGVDALDWLRLRRDLFDPQGIIGVAGFHFFYLAPLLHVMLDDWSPTPGLLVPADWRAALGRMAVVNLIGLVVYRGVLSYRGRRDGVASRGSRRHSLHIDERRFLFVGLLVVVIGIAAFVAEIRLFGGVSGFIATMTGPGEAKRVLLHGFGWLLAIAESFPLVLFMLVVVRWRAVLARRASLVVALLVAFGVVQFVAGGLRGSRSGTLFPLVIALILVHLLVVRVSRRALVAFVTFFLVFMYAYGLYKAVGLDVLEVGQGTKTVAELEDETGRDIPLVLLLDLGRADIQAVVLDRTLRGEGELAWGRTYLSGALLPAYGVLLERRPQEKIYYGSGMVLAEGTHDPGRSWSPQSQGWSPHIYGLAGEAMLNFGPVAGPLAFIPFAFAIRGARRLYARARAGNVLAAVIGAPLCFAAVLWLGMDTDNLVHNLLNRFAPVAIVVLLSLSVVRRRGLPALSGGGPSPRNR